MRRPNWSLPCAVSILPLEALLFLPPRPAAARTCCNAPGHWSILVSQKGPWSLFPILPPTSPQAHFSFHWLTGNIVPDFIEMLLKSLSLLLVLISFVPLMGYFLSPGLLHHQAIYYPSWFFVWVHKCEYSWGPALRRDPNLLNKTQRKPFTVRKTDKQSDCCVFLQK